MVGHTLHASNGAWSLDAGHPLLPVVRRVARRSQGATRRRTSRRAADAGHRLHVVVTASAPGYTPRSAASTATDRAKLGAIAWTSRRSAGTACSARRSPLTWRPPAPATATPHYRWLRGHRADPRRPRRDVRAPADDVGHHVHVQVTLRAENWVPVDQALARRDRPGPDRCRCCTRTPRSGHGRVVLRLRVGSPACAAATGRRAPGVPRRPAGRPVRRWSTATARTGSSPDAARHAHAHRGLPRRRAGDGRPHHGDGDRPLTLGSEDLEADPGRLEPLDQAVAHRLRGGHLAGGSAGCRRRPGTAPTRRASSRSRRSRGRRRRRACARPAPPPSPDEVDAEPRLRARARRRARRPA